MEKNVKLSQMNEIMQIMLNSGGTVRFNPHGTSMLPLIHNDGDFITIKKNSERLKRNDIALYRRKNGDFVLHRVVKVYEVGYGCCGDNQSTVETIIPESSIIGYVIEIERKGKKINLEKNIIYKLYSSVWTGILPLRKSFSLFKKYCKLFSPSEKEIEDAIEKFKLHLSTPLTDAENFLLNSLIAYICIREPLKRNNTTIKRHLFEMIAKEAQGYKSVIENNIMKLGENNIAVKSYNKFKKATTNSTLTAEQLLEKVC